MKVNTNKAALKMFEAEQKGLQAIEETATIAVPKVHHVDVYDDKAFMLMDYVESKSANENDYKALGAQLVQLHLNQKDQFGFTSDNFIGSLQQTTLRLGQLLLAQTHCSSIKTGEAKQDAESN